MNRGLTATLIGSTYITSVNRPTIPAFGGRSSSLALGAGHGTSLLSVSHLFGKPAW